MSGAFAFDPTARGAALSFCEAAIAAFLPGVPEITAEDLFVRLQGDPPILLDVRMPEEHAMGRIPGARLVPPGTPVPEVLTGAGIAEATPIVLSCAVGLRSGRMAKALLDHGLSPARVLNLRGGIFRWARLGLPMVDDRGPTHAVHPFDARWGQLLSR
ncbi:rhodanese-like domain-containing protein [Muricoccus aerilatus]|uniref:rhodanese-like domain-containing protein n=1 Tax=Muricoccus aerilatus TaxID=452982 RepID=UPI000693C613|nr:rhodanese-like domain-containing protein [Roseomonas aerilata]